MRAALVYAVLLVASTFTATGQEQSGEPDAPGVCNFPESSPITSAPPAPNVAVVITVGSDCSLTYELVPVSKLPPVVTGDPSPTAVASLPPFGKPGPSPIVG